MDMEEWEYLPDARFLDLDGEDCDKKILLGKRSSYSKSVFTMDDYYFIVPSSQERITDSPRSSRTPKQLVAVPVPVPFPTHLEPNIKLDNKFGDQSVNDTNIEVFLTDKVSVVPSASTEKIKASTVAADQDTVSQVFFKWKDNEFVDMKTVSPKSGSKGLRSQIDAGSGRFRFEDIDEPTESKSSPRLTTGIDSAMENDHNKENFDWGEKNGGLNLWKWTLTGVGAICSFGFAATICILYYGKQHRNKVQQNQKIRFQIYADGKSIERVMQHATKLNEAISAARGFPLTRAHITLGGYYDGI